MQIQKHAISETSTNPQLNRTRVFRLFGQVHPFFLGLFLICLYAFMVFGLPNYPWATDSHNTTSTGAIALIATLCGACYPLDIYMRKNRKNKVENLLWSRIKKGDDVDAVYERLGEPIRIEEQAGLRFLIYWELLPHPYWVSIDPKTRAVIEVFGPNSLSDN